MHAVVEELIAGEIEVQESNNLVRDTWRVLTNNLVLVNSDEMM